MYFAYVLKSLLDSKHYYGFSDNVNRRLQEHNNGKVPSTRNRRPFELVYFETFNTREEALKREKFFKSGHGRAYIKKKLKNISRENGPIV